MGRQKINKINCEHTHTVSDDVSAMRDNKAELQGIETTCMGGRMLHEVVNKMNTVWVHLKFPLLQDLE